MNGRLDVVGFERRMTLSSSPQAAGRRGRRRRGVGTAGTCRAGGRRRRRHLATGSDDDVEAGPSATRRAALQPGHVRETARLRYVRLGDGPDALPDALFLRRATPAHHHHHHRYFTGDMSP